MPILHIQGIDAEYRDLLPDEEILFEELPIENQYFRRPEIPFTDDELVEIAQVSYDERWKLYSPAQKKWVEREEKRMDDGVYAMIRGEIAFIPGSHYGYVCHWTLEDGGKPKYRNCTRKKFILIEYLRNHPHCLAITVGKSRRKGATTEGTFLEWWVCGRKEESIGGMVSYNDKSVAKIYQMLFMRGFKEMLPCFVRDFDSNSENFIRFRKPVESKKKGVPAIKREGLNSYIDHQPTTLNSYDSGRVTLLLGDEFGKWEKVDVNVYWSKVRPTLTKGSKKVGFAYIPTTVNPVDKGGEEYKIFWDNANQNTINPETSKPYGVFTPSKVVRIFDPAYEGYEGCVDKYGESIIEDPIEPTLNDDGELVTLGAKTQILNKRKGLTGLRLMEERRDYPLDIFDMFAFQSGICEFREEERIRARIKELTDTPVYWRQVRLDEHVIIKKSPVTGKETKRVEIKWMDDPTGCWWLLEEPHIKNNFSFRGFYDVQNAQHYKIGVDTYRNIFAIEGSDGVICCTKNSNIIDGVETGLYPFLIYVGRPGLVSLFHREIFKACLFCGCKANVESDAGTWFYEDFLAWDATDLLYWTPARQSEDTGTRMRIKPGTESAHPFQLAKQLEVAKIYFDGNNPQFYNGNIERCSYAPLLEQALSYNHGERTPYHIMVSFMLSLMPIFGIAERPVTHRPKQILPRYQITMPN